MLQNVQANDPIEFEDRQITPILTGLLILGCVIVYFLECTAGRSDWWLSHNVFHSLRAVELVQRQDWGSLITMGFFTTFASLPLFKLPLQMAFNMYFLWVFGKHVEQKLGPPRYILLILTGMYLPMIALYYTTLGRNDTFYVGPIFLLSAIVGTYIVFPPIPKSKYGAHNVKARGEIFRREPRENPLDKYTANPWKFVVGFGIIQLVLHFWITMGFGPFEPIPGYDTFDVIGIAVAIVIGYIMGQLLHHQATKSLKVGPMTLAAVKRYNELIDLDVSPDEAIKGTARTLGLPYDKVKEWVTKNKGSMRVK